MAKKNNDADSSQEKEPKKSAKKRIVITQGILDEAIQSVRKGMSVRKASAKYGIPKSTLSDRVSGKRSTIPRKGPIPALDDEIEDKLETFLIAESKRNIFYPRRQVFEIVKEMLDLSGQKIDAFTDNLPGKSWWEGFHRRHPAVKSLCNNQKQSSVKKQKGTSDSVCTETILSVLRLPPTCNGEVNSSITDDLIAIKTRKAQGIRKQSNKESTPNATNAQVAVISQRTQQAQTKETPTPVIYTRKTYAKTTQEQFDEALQSICDGMSLRTASAKYGIPRSTLSDRVSGKRCSLPRKGAIPALPKVIEDNLEAFIIAEAERGIVYPRKQIWEIVKQIADVSGQTIALFDNNMPGKSWWEGFKHRHPKIQNLADGKRIRSVNKLCPTVVANAMLVKKNDSNNKRKNETNLLSVTRNKRIRKPKKFFDETDTDTLPKRKIHSTSKKGQTVVTKRARITNDMLELDASLQSIQDGMSLKDASNEYGIPLLTLSKRLSDWKSSRKESVSVLSSEDEHYLVDFLLSNARKGIIYQQSQIFDIVKEILDSNGQTVAGFTDNVPDESWWEDFQSRHPTLLSLREQINNTENAVESFTVDCSAETLSVEMLGTEIHENNEDGDDIVLIPSNTEAENEDLSMDESRVSVSSTNAIVPYSSESSQQQTEETYTAMVPKKRTTLTQEILDAAMQSVHDGMSVRKAAIKYGIPKSTLSDRVSGKRCSLPQRGPLPVLPVEVEDSLEAFIIAEVARGVVYPRKQVWEIVKQILDLSGQTVDSFHDNLPGKSWWEGFKGRHPKLQNLADGKRIRSIDSFCPETIANALLAHKRAETLNMPPVTTHLLSEIASNRNLGVEKQPSAIQQKPNAVVIATVVVPLPKKQTDKTSAEKSKVVKKRAQVTQEQLDEALKSIREGGMTVRNAATKYGIPRSTLGDRISGKRSDLPQKNSTMLTKEEEKQLETFLVDQTKQGLSYTRDQILLIVKQLLDLSGREVAVFKDNKPGRSWFSAFKKRHPRLENICVRSNKRCMQTFNESGLLCQQTDVELQSAAET